MGLERGGSDFVALLAPSIPSRRDCRLCEAFALRSMSTKMGIVSLIRF